MDFTIKESDKSKIDNLMVVLSKATMTLTGAEVMIASQAMTFLANIQKTLNTPPQVKETSTKGFKNESKKAK